MSGRTIKIKWSYGTEYIQFDDIREGATIHTREYRPYLHRFVEYVVNIEDYNSTGNKLTAKLVYRRNEQTDPFAKNSDNCNMGSNIIVFNKQSLRCSAEWVDEINEEYNGKVQAEFIGEQSPFSGPHPKASINVILRPKQSELRRDLFYFDRKCVLTGEGETVALDAAHIVPVKAGGSEVAGNAILLRTDLHRLFDAGLFWFEVDEDRAEVKFSSDLSKEYQRVLKGKSLGGDTFGRVRVALAARAKLPGGTGVDETEGQ